MALIVLDETATVDSKAKPSSVGFCIDTHEFPGAGQKPRGGASRATATSLCKKAGKALCRGAQWLKACETGTPEASKCNVTGGVQPAGSYAECVTSNGVYDMIGNVGEWTSDNFIRGGDTNVGGIGSCSYKTKRFSPKSTDGFRCCANPTTR